MGAWNATQKLTSCSTTNFLDNDVDMMELFNQLFGGKEKSERSEGFQWENVKGIILKGAVSDQVIVQ